MIILQESFIHSTNTNYSPSCARHCSRHKGLALNDPDEIKKIGQRLHCHQAPESEFKPRSNYKNVRYYPAPPPRVAGEPL